MIKRIILVTGSNGQLGNELRELSDKYTNYEFVFTDINELDITDIDALDIIVKKNSINTIINCAAYTAVDKAEDDRELALKINSSAVENLAKISQKYNVQLIHISTDYVYKGNSYLPYTENNITDPINYYGFSKLQGENAILKLNINALIIRTSWLYSSFGNNFVKTILRLTKERNELKVVFDQIGTPTYAADLAQTILQILSSDKPSINKPEIYQYSNEGVISWYDFAKAIVFEKSIKIIPVRSSEFPTPANRPNYSVLDKTKIKKDYKIEIPYWKDSLLKCLKKLRNND